MSDIISQAMGILGGTKKSPTGQLKEQAPAPVPTRAPTPTPTPVPARAPAQVRDRLTSVERKVVSELARFASLHAQIIEIRQRMEQGESLSLVESRLEDTLRNAKITIR